MILEPHDISRFIYCPLLPKGVQVYEESTPFESYVGKAIVETEHYCLLKDSTLVQRKMINTWDNLWWPACPSLKIPFKEASKLSIQASAFFADYCKYDISDYTCPTISTNVESQVNIGSSILKAKVDLLDRKSVV